VDYYRRQYVANAAVVSIAGAIKVTEAKRLVQEGFADWAGGAPADWHRVREEPRGARYGAIVKSTEQAHLSLGVRGLSLEDPDRYAADVLSVILGEGMSSRLFNRLREELGLCYDIHSYTAHMRDTGSFGVYAGVDPDKAREAVSEIAIQLGRIREHVTPEELARAQSLLRSRMELRMEDSRSVSAWYGSQAILELPQLSPEETMQRTDAVTLDDLRRVAGRLFSDERLQLAVVGPFEGIDLFEGVSVGA
jgi:predicted Zn-dependent peptidase